MQRIVSKPENLRYGVINSIDEAGFPRVTKFAFASNRAIGMRSAHSSKSFVRLVPGANARLVIHLVSPRACFKSGRSVAEVGIGLSTSLIFRSSKSVAAVDLVAVVLLLLA